MAPEGRPILLATALVAILAVFLGLVFPGRALLLTLLGLIPLAFSLHFFRDPRRKAPAGSALLVAPADGKIIEIAEASAAVSDPLVFDFLRQAPTEEFQRIAIFMSPFNVHVNRIPIAGRIAALRHQPGRFSAAFEAKASLHNERQFIGLETAFGPLACVQIAGWLARRIVCHLQLGQQVAAGDRFGMIRFGSRVDLYFPRRCHLRVRLGQKVIAGETIIGSFTGEKG